MLNGSFISFCTAPVFVKEDHINEGVKSQVTDDNLGEVRVKWHISQNDIVALI